MEQKKIMVPWHLQWRWKEEQDFQKYHHRARKVKLEHSWLDEGTRYNSPQEAQEDLEESLWFSVTYSTGKKLWRIRNRVSGLTMDILYENGKITLI